MTNKQIKEARELCDAATDGPWQTRFIYRLFSDARQNPKLMMQGDGSTDWKDSDFIAQAHTLLPAALDEIERLRWLNREHWDVPNNRMEWDDGSRLLRYDTDGWRLQCCLGFMGSECGVPDVFLMNQARPINLHALVALAFPRTIVDFGETDPDDQVGLVPATEGLRESLACHTLIGVNDCIATPPEEREQLLRIYGLIAGIDFQFIGEYRVLRPDHRDQEALVEEVDLVLV